MCSYNRINGSYGCQNSKLLNGVLKEELGFQGYGKIGNPIINPYQRANKLAVMSDWEATHAGVAPILAGLDMNMPGGIAFTETAHSYFGGNLTMAVNNGSVPIERVDDMVRRIMTPYYRLNQNRASFPGIDPSSGGLNFFPRRSH
jgi:beta-glucosidase